MINILLADIIYCFHIFIILFVIIIPFIKIPFILILHIVFCLCLFVHWYQNSDICCLTLFEAHLRGINKNETILQQFIGPIYNISLLKWNKLIWIITIILLFISIFNLFTSNNIKQIITYYNNIESNIEKKDIMYIIKLLVLI